MIFLNSTINCETENSTNVLAYRLCGIRKWPPSVRSASFQTTAGYDINTIVCRPYVGNSLSTRIYLLTCCKASHGDPTSASLSDPN